MTDLVRLKRMANAIRALAMDAVEKAKSGHPGMPMGMADVATVLFTRFLKFDAADPHWPDRDRFVLSAGHGSMLLYSLLYLTGYDGMTHRRAEAFPPARHRRRPAIPRISSRRASRPPPARSARASPMPSAWRWPSGMLAAEFGDDVVDHHTYVLACDGDLMEGISQEAIALAGHLKLNKLIVLFDDNGISIDGAAVARRIRPTRWSASRPRAGTPSRIDGHDPDAIAAAIDAAQKSRPPDA